MSDYVTVARIEALERRRSQGRQLAPFRFLIAAVVITSTLSSTPAASFGGRGLGVTLSLVVFVASLLAWPRWVGPQIRDAVRLVPLGTLAASGLALAFFQPGGNPEFALSATVFIGGVALPSRWALVFDAVATTGLAIALATALNASAETVIASVLLCAVLGVTGALLRRARLSQDRTELLLAELQAMRDESARAAALAERATIARELHDVLAHSLSGLSLQLEGARKLAAADGAGAALRDTIDRAATLAKQGLVEARDAVGALRHGESINVERLPSLVEHFRADLGLDVVLRVDGAARELADDVGLVLYRVVGEALTNVTRHAPRAHAVVELRWRDDGVHLVISDDGDDTAEAPPTSGWGLLGVRERVQRLDGHFRAGPANPGWRVEVEVPA